MRGKKRSITAAAMAAAVTGTMLVTAGPASAAPTGCTISFPDASHVASLCTGGTGHHSIDVRLKHPNPMIPFVEVQGDWAAVGQYSIVEIPAFPIIFTRVNLVDW